MAAASSHRSKRRAVRKHRRDLPRPINDLVTSPNRSEADFMNAHIYCTHLARVHATVTTVHKTAKLQPDHFRCHRKRAFCNINGK